LEIITIAFKFGINLAMTISTEIQMKTQVLSFLTNQTAKTFV